MSLKAGSRLHLLKKQWWLMIKKRFFQNDFDLFIFRDSALMVVAAVVSLLLQVISFFTTLDGAKAYFETTFALAPLFFALAVQSVVYFLENSIRRKATAAKVIALSMAIFCSSYFSFVGIYNNINPPESYLEKTYNSYSAQLRKLAEDISFSDAADSGAEVNKAVNGIIREYSALTAERSSLESLAEQISEARAENSVNLSPPRRWDYAEYEDYAAAYSAYISSLSQSGTTEQSAKITALLQKYGFTDPSEVSARSAEITARISLIEGTVGAQGNAFYSAAELLRGRIVSGSDSALAERLFALYNDLYGERLEVPNSLFTEKADVILPEYIEISGGMPAAAVREKLISVISAACDTVNSMGGSVNSEDYGFENIYTLPMYAVFSGRFGADAAVSLVLALLVDILSLLFAMIFVKQRSILAAKNTDDAADMRGSLFEQNVVTALQLGLCGSGADFSAEWSWTDLTERIAEYLCAFRAADFAVDKGYSLIAKHSDIAEFEALTAFLCQFGLAKILTAEETELLTNGETDSRTVLLKTKFLLWVSEKFCIPEKIDDSRGEVA